MEYLTSIAGVRCPPLLYGTAWKQQETARLVQTALAVGFRGVDTAGQPKHYDEAGVGVGLAESGVRREQLYVQTKFTPLGGHDPRRVPYDPRAQPAQQVAQSFAASLRHLRTDYVDSLVLHSPTDLAQLWPAMEALVDTGAVRQLGLSNCHALATLEALWRAARIKPAVLQNRFHADTGYDRALRAFCCRYGMLYQSFWTLTANPHVLAHRTLRDLAQRHGRSPPQLWFRYLTQIGIVPLTGTRSEAHMRDDLSIFAFALSPPECAMIGAVLGEGPH